MGVCGIDIGYKNFAYFASNADFSEVLGYGKFDISGNKKVTRIVRKHLDTLAARLRERAPLWNECGSILIEHQLRVNAKAQRVENHTESYFLLEHPRLVVELVSPGRKSAMLGDAVALPRKTKKEKGQRSRELKKNAVRVAEKLLSEKMGLSAERVSEILLSAGAEDNTVAGKKDDIADCVIMAYQGAMAKK